MMIVNEFWPVSLFRMEVFLKTVEGATQPLIVGCSRAIRRPGEHPELVLNLGLSRCEFERAVEDGKRAVGETRWPAESAFESEWGIAQLFNVGTVAGCVEQLLHLPLALRIQSQRREEVVCLEARENDRQSGANADSESPPATYLLAAASTYSLTRSKASMEPPSSSAIGDSPSSNECDSRNQSFSTSRSRKSADRLLRIWKRWAILSRTSLPRTLLRSLKDLDHMTRVGLIETKQEYGIVLAEIPKLQQFEDELDRSRQSRGGLRATRPSVGLRRVRLRDNGVQEISHGRVVRMPTLPFAVASRLCAIFRVVPKQIPRSAVPGLHSEPAIRYSEVCPAFRLDAGGSAPLAWVTVKGVHQSSPPSNIGPKHTDPFGPPSPSRPVSNPAPPRPPWPTVIWNASPNDISVNSTTIV